MPKHIARLILLMVAFGAAAYAAKIFFTTDSFYDYGHYRGASVAEIASDKPKYKGSKFCESCHTQQYAVWSKGVHHSADLAKAVQCEACHGAAGGRDAGGMFQHVATGVDHPASGKLFIPADTLKLCSLCHEKMPGRPAEQRQIVIASHAGTQQCTSCHNPHSPRLFVATAAPATQPGNNAAAKAASCAGCHGGDGVSTNPAWPSLAGQQSAYVVEALKAYQSGARDNAMMAATVKGLSDADIQNLAGYYATLKIKTATTAAADQHILAGKARSATCVACHGATGASANPAWPSLAGQQKDYMVVALKAYKSGTRKNEVMSGIAKGLSDDDMEALAAYYSSTSLN